MNKTIKCTSKFLLFILFLTIIGWTYSCLKLKALSNHINEQNNQHQKYHDILNNTNIFIDSLQHEIKHLREIFDSLPLGPPLDTLAINDGFGIRKHPILGSWQMHSGVDMIDTYRDTVYATGDGIVQYAYWNYGYGKCVEIEHAFNFKSKYAHLHKILIKKGDLVKKGQPIALMGATGDVTGQHLHYEISHKNKSIDPMPYLTCVPINVKATMYHPVEEQCDDDPLVTADGSIIDPYMVSDWNWIAVSQDMLKKNGGIFNYGDKVYIKGTHKDGIYTIHDCMNKRKTLQIDFLENIGTKQYKYDEIEIYALI
jgi:3D (Asp-Asp-Asp) domain-containing protein